MRDANSPLPSFDLDGYPTEETERMISNWSYLDPLGWINFISKAWYHYYGSVIHEGKTIHFSTGGWSGNESIVSAMKRNSVLWSMLWESSHRGGLEVLRLPKNPSPDCVGSV